MTIWFICSFYLQSICALHLNKYGTRLLSGIFCLGGMTYTPFNGDDTYRREFCLISWNGAPSYASTPGYLDREWTPSVICPSPNPEGILVEHPPAFHRQLSDKLDVLPAVEHEGGSTWNEQSQNCFHYQVEWKVTLNNRVVRKDRTRPDSATKILLAAVERESWTSSTSENGLLGAELFDIHSNV